MITAGHTLPIEAESSSKPVTQLPTTTLNTVEQQNLLSMHHIISRKHTPHEGVGDSAYKWQVEFEDGDKRWVSADAFRTTRDKLMFSTYEANHSRKPKSVWRRVKPTDTVEATVTQAPHTTSSRRYVPFSQRRRKPTKE